MILPNELREFSGRASDFQHPIFNTCTMVVLVQLKSNQLTKGDGFLDENYGTSMIIMTFLGQRCRQRCRCRWRCRQCRKRQVGSKEFPLFLWRKYFDVVFRSYDVVIVIVIVVVVDMAPAHMDQSPLSFILLLSDPNHRPRDRHKVVARVVRRISITIARL